MDPFPETMDAIVLAGGFARRMWPLTKERPKQLLDVGGRPVLGYVLDAVREAPVGRVILSTNAQFEGQFRAFLSEGGWEVELVAEPATCEGEKLGSLGALGYVIDHTGIEGGVLVVGGDNLFSLSLADLVRESEARNADVVAVFDLGSKERAGLYGVVETDRSGRIVGFEEKPASPRSSLVATACYALSRSGVEGLRAYLRTGLPRDAMGHYIAWSIREREVYAHIFDGYWFDIGSLEVLAEADRYFGDRHKDQP